MSRLAAAALRGALTASGARSYSTPVAFPLASSRLFSTDASGAVAGSQDDSSSGEGHTYGRFYTNISGVGRLGKNMLKTDIIHYLDQCELSLDDVKIDYNKGFYPMGALLKFPSVESFEAALRQTIQGRMYRLERVSPDVWEHKISLNGKAVLLQGVPRSAQADDIERFLCGTNYEPPPFENFVRAGVPEPVRMVLVKFGSRTDATNAFIAKNKGFCLNSPVTMRVIQ
ncbi:uncharacterized protein LOC123448969 [Hordeum vulgare subsp. vulgare]|uniref:Uncharacterized protein n=1 Tax=Hordeum vulgare subsp. vulgare TaxID=112509 RepID=A0A8I6XIW4_HORVV|nr:uncharacterized protein LOC123448969 [Hordeum vulgare subsp. vulgare]KAI4994030.1 hypothetical protein ZWY2020_008343 [Hordeum vulgare]